MNKRFDFRVAVGSPHSPRSSVWHFWSRNSEVYVTFANMGGVQKFSFHTPDICRLAYTKEFGLRSSINNRASHEWRRDPTPNSGMNRVVRVLRAHFPTDLLSENLELPTKFVNWTPAAPRGSTTVIDLMFTNDSKATLEALLLTNQEVRQKLLVHKLLPNGEAYAITSSFFQGGTEMIRMPASHGHTDDIIVSPDDPMNTGRPVRLTIFSNPNVGDLIDVWEFGAYRTTPISEDVWHRQFESFRQNSRNNL